MSKRRSNGTKVESKEEEISPLTRLRNMEEFAALGQFLFMFGTGVLGLPDFNLEASGLHTSSSMFAYSYSYSCY